MGSSYSEIRFKQQIAVLEGKNKALSDYLRKKERNCVRLEKENQELQELASRSFSQILSEKMHRNKNQKTSDLPGGSGENLTWILSLDCREAEDLCRSFCRHHPVFEGKIILAEFPDTGDISASVAEMLSAYNQDNIRHVHFEETGLDWTRVVSSLAEEIETDWIMYISADFQIAAPFLSDIYDEVTLSGCHFINLPAAFSDSLKCIRQRVCVDTEWRSDGEWIIIPQGDDEADEIPEYTRSFTGDSGIFKKNTFIEFGRYLEEFGALSSLEFSARISAHNYAVANFSRPVLVKRDDRPFICSDEELQKYNSKVGGLEFCAEHSGKKWKVAVIIDEEGWAYYNIAMQLKKNLTDMDIDIFCSKYADSIVELFFALKEYDIAHVLWRGILQFLDPETAATELYKYGMSYQEFKQKYLNQLCLTTAVYDHLYLEENAGRVTEKILSAVDEYTVSSGKLFHIYSDRYDKKPSEEITDGVDLDIFGPDNLDRFNDIADRPVCIGWVGNSVFWGNKSEDLKGVHTILNPAIEELQKEGFNIIKFYADKQERTIPHDKMREYYSKIDIYICTSRIEGTPNPVLEAMACGVPVISTDVGIVPEVFGEFQKQFILERRDVECLKDMIKKMVSDTENLKRCSQENLSRIQNWNWKQKCRQYGDFFKQAYKRKVRRRME